VDSAFLSQIYASKFNKTPQQASQEIDTVINGTRNFPSFFQVKQPAHLSPAPPSSTRSNFTRIDWADFSVGSVYAIGGIKKPA
jgi:hypothetical protein